MTGSDGYLSRDKKYLNRLQRERRARLEDNISSIPSILNPSGYMTPRRS